MPNTPQDRDSPRSLDTLKMSDSDWRKLADQLDRETAGADFASQRGHERVPYRSMVQAICEVSHPGGNRVRFIVRTRDLSASGIGFFHGQFLHAGSRCTIYLNRSDGKQQPLIGTVRRCEHVNGKTHEIGVEFDKLIEPSDFLLYRESA